MASILHADPLMDSTASTSIFTMLFKQKESQDCPQEEDEPVSTKDEVPISTKVGEPQCQRLPLPVKQPTLLADLHLLQQTTQQLQNATLASASNNSDDTGDANADTENLATLYCRRAAALLAFVDYDATTSVPLDILASESSANDSHDEANQPAPMLEAVRQALQDSQAAAALTLNKATLAEAHLLSAYSSRSLGELSHARAFIALATEALPGSTALTSLAEQLDVEARTDGTELLPKLRMTSETLATLSRSSDVPTIVEEEDNNGQPEQKTTKGEPLNSTPVGVVQRSFWSQVATPFQVLEEAARSSWLKKIERIMHQNVHHRCAHPSEVRQLDAALQAALAALTQLLQCSAVCSMFELNMATDDAARTLEKLNQAASSSSQTLVQNRTARKWIVQTWAPAVRRAVVSASRSPLIDLSSDVLLMLSRSLQASGSWRRCTATSHGLAYAEMGFDLAKYCRGNFTDPSAWTRLEMQCAEAYATALLQRTSGHKDALKTSRETLQAALHVGDREYELRSRLLVARTLRFMNEREIAHAELVLLLERSRALNDVHMEAMAEYELGEHFVQNENLEAAQEHFHIAQALCNRTGNCGNSWRPQSIQQAIAFYAQLRPITRRGAMRCSVSTLLQPVNDEDNSASMEAQDNDEDNDEQEEDTLQRPKARRQAFYLKQEQPEPQSVMSKLFNTTDSLGGPKPKRTTSWRESVFAEAWPETAVAQ